MHNKYKRWPYTNNTVRYMRSRERRNRSDKSKREKQMEAVEVEPRTDLSPRIKNQVNVLMNEADKLGRLATEEGDADMIGLAAMMSTTLELLMGVEE